MNTNSLPPAVRDPRSDVFRSPLSSIGLTILRVGLGAILIVHGYDKLSHYSEWIASLSSMGFPAPEVLGPLAIAGELAGGLGILLGFLTPVAAVGALCVMLAAIIGVHWEHGLMAENGGFEYPLILALSAIYFLVRGAGPYSVDQLLLGTRNRATEALEERVLADAPPPHRQAVPEAATLLVPHPRGGAHAR